MTAEYKLHQKSEKMGLVPHALEHPASTPMFTSTCIYSIDTMTSGYIDNDIYTSRGRIIRWSTTWTITWTIAWAITWS